MALKVAETLGKQRVPAVLLLDLIMTDAPPQFVEALRAIQNKDTWQTALAALMQGWQASTKKPRMLEARTKNSGGFGFDMWSRSCREVETAYFTWGNPMKRMEAIADPPLICHAFSHPKAPEYSTVHEEFSVNHPDWFSFVRLHGETHFPGIEIPESVALVLKGLVEKLSS